ncbi:hypothetical protein [Qipengyuania sp. 902]|uniref:hypothetical protein n=1 Tax=Qipengyuania sp. 902 TaxID=3417565 RepID=UPI003EB8D72A
MLEKIALLERLAAARQAGHLSEAEFAEEKSLILASFSHSAPAVNGSEEFRASRSTAFWLPIVVLAAVIAVAIMLWWSSTSPSPAANNQMANNESGASSTKDLEQPEIQLAAAPSADLCQRYQFVQTSTGVDSPYSALYAYFAMSSPIESSVYGQLRQNGGVAFTDVKSVRGECHAEFAISGVVDGTSYNLRVLCPIKNSDPPSEGEEGRTITGIESLECFER